MIVPRTAAALMLGAAVVSVANGATDGQTAGIGRAQTAEAAEAAARCEALLADPAAPFAVRHLYRIAALRDWLPPQTAEGCVDEVAARRGVPAETVALARSLRATWAMEAGRIDRARDEAARAGAVSDWEIAGPFADPLGVPQAVTGSMLDVVVDAAVRGEGGPFEGVRGSTEFRPLPAPRPDGVVDVGRAVADRPGACAVIRAHVPGRRGRTATLRLGGPARMEAWIGGERRIALDPVRGPATLRAAASIPASRTPTRIVVVACSRDSFGEIRVLLDGAAGGDASSAVEDALVLLDSATRRARAADADELLAAAELVVEAGAMPNGVDPVASAIERLPAEYAARVALLRSRSAATGAERWSAAARAAILRPEALDPLLELATQGAALPGAPGVDDALARAVEWDPPCRRAIAARAWALVAAGMPSAAVASLGGALNDPLSPPGTLRALRGVAERAGRTDLAAGAAERILAVRPFDHEAWATAVEADIARGDYGAVRARLENAPWWSGRGDGTGSGSWAIELERLAAATLLRIGDIDAAVDRLARLAGERPDDAAVRADLGWALLRSGRRTEAGAALAAAAAAGSTDEAVRWWIATRGEELDADGLLASWEEIEATALETAAGPAPAESVAYAFRGVLVSVGPSGAVRQRERRAMIVRDRGAAAALPPRIVLASYDPTRTVFRLARGVVRGADGSTRAHAGVDTVSADVPGARAFSDRRVAAIRLPPLDEGDLVEIDFELVDVGATVLPPRSLAKEIPLREAHPTSLLRIVVASSDDTTIRADVPAGLVTRSGERRDGGRTIRTWDMGAVPAVAGEPLGPPIREAVGAVRLTTFASWREVADWIAGLFRPAIDRRDDRVAAAAAGLDAAGVYRRVAASIRYVAAEYGSHGMAPAPPGITLARGYGDCKDKVALLLALLREIGVDGRVVLLRTRFVGEDPSGGAFPYPYAFDHVIAYLPPPIDLYVDPTVVRTPWDVLPRGARGAMGLLFGDPAEPPRIVRLPEAGPDGEGVVRYDRLLMDASGGAALMGRIEARGADAGDVRALLTAPDLRMGALTAMLRNDFRDARVVAADVGGLSPDDPAIHAEYLGSVPGFGRAEADGLSVPAGTRLDLLSRVGSLESRSTDLELASSGFPMNLDHEVEVIPHGAWTWERVPQQVAEEGPFGAFSLESAVEGTRLIVSVSVRLPRLRIAAGEYPAFREFIRRIDDALAQTALAVRRLP